jgi:very-short-patch-repair endonuclease
MHSNTNYNSKNQSFAHQLRQEMTKVEACLWKYALKAGKIRGYTFRRQRPVLDFIVDFICIPLRLVIEVDGYSHFLNEVILKDKTKEKALKKPVMRLYDLQIRRY